MINIPIRFYRKFPPNQDYLVSTDGNVVSTKFGKFKLLSPALTAGYKHVITSNEGKPTGYCVHRMVAITYLPNDSGLPSVNHKNGDKLDNRCDNLEWCSHAYNMQHSYDNSLRSGKKGVSNPSAKLDYNKAAEIRELRYSKGTRYIDLAEMYGVSRFTISSIISGKRWNINDL